MSELDAQVVEALGKCRLLVEVGKYDPGVEVRLALRKLELAIQDADRARIRQTLKGGGTWH